MFLSSRMYLGDKMKMSTKAALLSALVYPGAGHFFLKKYFVCVTLVCAFSVPLFLVIRGVVEKTNKVAELIVSGSIPLDLASITEAVSNTVIHADTPESNVRLYVMLLVWFVGVLDAYRVGIAKT